MREHLSRWKAWYFSCQFELSVTLCFFFFAGKFILWTGGTAHIAFLCAIVRQINIFLMYFLSFLYCIIHPDIYYCFRLSECEKHISYAEVLQRPTDRAEISLVCFLWSSPHAVTCFVGFCCLQLPHIEINFPYCCERQLTKEHKNEHEHHHKTNTYRMNTSTHNLWAYAFWI